jgi:hypothetical protein
VIGVASLVGAVLGIYFRNAIDNCETFRRSALIGARGALMIVVCVGYIFAGSHGSATALGSGLATAMLTFCLFTPVTITAFRGGGDRVVVRHEVALGAIGIGAGTVGSAIGELIA